MSGRKPITDLINAEEAAKRTGYNITYLRALAADGRVPGARKHKAQWLFNPDRLREWTEGTPDARREAARGVLRGMLANEGLLPRFSPEERNALRILGGTAPFVAPKVDLLEG